MFRVKIRKIMYTPVNLFYYMYIKVVLRGRELHEHVNIMGLIKVSMIII